MVIFYGLTRPNRHWAYEPVLSLLKFHPTLSITYQSFLFQKIKIKKVRIKLKGDKQADSSPFAFVLWGLRVSFNLFFFFKVIVLVFLM